MSGTGAGYDQSTSTFSPDGRVFQVEYAAKAAEKSGTTIGIRCKDGVVLGVEKIITHKMLVPTSNRKVYTVDEHVGIACAGLTGDADKLANVAREESYKYRDFYKTEIPGRILNKRLA
jgi:20S proteasome subunit alpha 7